MLGARRDPGGRLTAKPAYAIRGDDPELVAQRARALLDELRGGEGLAATVEDHGPAELDAAEVVSDCSTPPLLSVRRVVVVRDAGTLRRDQVAALCSYLEDPLHTTSLVLVGGGGPFPPKLVDAVRAVGEVLDAGPGRDRAGWLAGAVGSSAVSLDRSARERVLGHVGEDLSRVQGLLGVLSAAYGEGARVGASEVEAFLGEAGSVPPWDLTDAIDAGDAGRALEMLRRMTTERHPLGVLYVLHRHFASMLRLDGSGAGTPAEAAEVLGARGTFTAGKSLARLRRLGPAGVGRAMALLAQADLDLRGETAQPAAGVLEILVARLSRLRSSRPSPRS